jgi:hypothetical protein
MPRAAALSIPSVTAWDLGFMVFVMQLSLSPEALPIAGQIWFSKQPNSLNNRSDVYPNPQLT